MDTFFNQKNRERMGKVLLLLGIAAVLYVGMKFVNEMKAFDGGASDLANASTIDVSGTGTAFAIPNIASESFTIEQKAATVAAAQAAVTGKANAAVAFLKSAGVAEKDIQTTNYSAYPEYSYPNPCSSDACPLSAKEPKLLGYTVSETITVKIRNTENVGTIIDGLGSRGVTGLSGPDFTVDNPDTVNAQARKLAIDDAEAKAEVLARDLGVDLVRVVRFNESAGGGYPMPMYAAKDSMAVGAAAPTSVLPAGQNKYVSNVTITYEIR